MKWRPDYESAADDYNKAGLFWNENDFKYNFMIELLQPLVFGTPKTSLNVKSAY